jgi:hypothetical protein
MDWQTINENWALFAASVPAMIVIGAIWISVWRKSSRGKLSATIAAYRDDLKQFEAAKKKQAAAEGRVERLLQRANKVKPRVLQEARDAVTDATSLAQLIDNKVQVSANLVRKVIFKEYPPNQHDKLRARYLPGDVADGRPFSF